MATTSTKLFALFSCIFLCASAVLKAQHAPQRRIGEILIQLEGDATPSGVAGLLNQYAPDAHFDLSDDVVRNLRIYRLRFDETATNADNTLKITRSIPGIRYAQWNRLAEDRSVTPDDPEWPRQVDMGIIGVREAWEYTTGGLTSSGDTIVVAILEKGMRKDHPAIAPNIWINWGEIPNNEIDDDGNGYIDDRTGFDAQAGKGDGNGPGNSHGTSVNAIIGAKGNDAVGVTGVNWNVKLLNISNVYYESDILAAYGYCRDQRRLYNQTNGAQGAFIVATNASFGINNGMPEEYPLWCAIYDDLGQEGVLNVGATANSHVNVDIDGDMPTACPSVYLITVTNTDRDDNKVFASGYGIESIDLGAPGDGTFTAINPQGTTYYGNFPGTSAACPHVTGSVALLYATPCNSFTADALQYPSICADRVRQTLLYNVEPNATLDTATVTGGRLDVATALEDIYELCPGSTGQLQITDLRPNPVSDRLYFRYLTPNYEDNYTLRIFDAAGRLIVDQTLVPDPYTSRIYEYDVQNLPRAVYILSLSHGNDCVTKKFVKI